MQLKFLTCFFGGGDTGNDDNLILSDFLWFSQEAGGGAVEQAKAGHCRLSLSKKTSPVWQPTTALVVLKKQNWNQMMPCKIVSYDYVSQYSSLKIMTASSVGLDWW